MRNEVIYTCMCNTGILLTSKGRMNLKGFLSIFIASAITAGVNEIDPHLNRHDHSCKGSLDL